MLITWIIGFVLWRHYHECNCAVHGQVAPLILIGDVFHNFVDGIVIAAAFLTSVPLGITASIAIITHEIPQEVGAHSPIQLSRLCC